MQFSYLLIFQVVPKKKIKKLYKLKTISVKEPYLFVLLPHTACDACLKSIKEYLNSLPKKENSNISVVFVTRSKKEYQYLITGYDTSVPIISDSRGLAYEKDLINAQTPTIVKFLPHGKSEIKEYTINEIFQFAENINKFMEKY